MKEIPWYQIGMFASKWLAKRFGAKALESDPSSWGAREYIQGGIGSVAAGYICNMIKPGTGHMVMLGGLNLMIYEMIQNELIAPNAWASGQFGADDEMPTYTPGEIEYDNRGVPHMLGQDYQWRELPSQTSQLQQVGPLGALEPVGPLGALEPVGPLGADAYARALLS